MRRPLLFVGGLAAVALLGLGTMTVAAAFGDGPTGPFPGGRLSGQHIEGSEADWDAASARETVEVQVGLESPRSVLACLLMLEGEPHLSVTLAPLKSWHEAALAEGRVTIRIDGMLYERGVRRVTDEETHSALKAIAFAKYASYEFGDGWAGRNLEFLRIVGPPAG
jgi:hypothetical protein